MDREVTLAIKRAGIVLPAVLVALGCGGGSLSGQGGAGGSGGSGGGGGSAATCCPDGGVSVTSIVRGRSFLAYEGLTVKAVFTWSTLPAPQTRETSVVGGAFDLEFPPDAATCASPRLTAGAGALYIDNDGDGVCNPGVDYLYAWSALGAAGNTCATIDLTPQSPNCSAEETGVDGAILNAVQTVCPAFGGCFSCPLRVLDGGSQTGCFV